MSQEQTARAEDVFLASRQVRARYGDSSDMWLWRRLHDDDSGFPQPLKIHGRRFWKLSDLEIWERSLAVKPTDAVSNLPRKGNNLSRCRGAAGPRSNVRAARDSGKGVS